RRARRCQSELHLDRDIIVHLVTNQSNSHARVLIVEDQALIRMEAVSMVEETGRQIVEASDADEAICILTSRTDINVLFTDVEMPGSMDGYALARTVHARWPDIAIVTTSGRRTPGTGDLPAGGRFMVKPYDSV